MAPGINVNPACGDIAYQFELLVGDATVPFIAAWSGSGVNYTAKQLVKNAGFLFEALDNHTSTSDNGPSASADTAHWKQVSSLFARIVVSAGDVYNTGGANSTTVYIGNSSVSNKVTGPVQVQSSDYNIMLPLVNVLLLYATGADASAKSLKVGLVRP